MKLNHQSPAELIRELVHILPPDFQFSTSTEKIIKEILVIIDYVQILLHLYEI